MPLGSGPIGTHPLGGIPPYAPSSITCTGDVHDTAPYCDGFLVVPIVTVGGRRARRARPVQVIDCRLECVDASTLCRIELKSSELVLVDGDCRSHRALASIALIRVDRHVFDADLQDQAPLGEGSIEQDMQPVYNEEVEILELLEVAGIFD